METKRKVKIIRGQSERGGAVRGRPSYRWVLAWRVVDAETGQDVVQPYFDRLQGGKTAARKHCKDCGYELVSVDP